jgi:hypothetical protein
MNNILKFIITLLIFSAIGGISYLIYIITKNNNNTIDTPPIETIAPSIETNAPSIETIAPSPLILFKSGQPCDKKDECENNNCGKTGKNSSQSVCCPSGKSSFEGGTTVCHGDTDEGGDCWNKKQCKPGFTCNGGAITNGKCVVSKKGYESCSIDNECMSNNCCRLTNGSSKLQCRPDGWLHTTYKTGGYDMCYPPGGYSTGTPCKGDRQCTSGNCKGNNHGIGSGNCT